MISEINRGTYFTTCRLEECGRGLEELVGGYFLFQLNFLCLGEGGLGEGDLTGINDSFW